MNPRMRCIAIFSLLVLNISFTSGNKEHDHSEHDRHHSHDHSEHDHESHRKLFTDNSYDGTEDGQKEKLRSIASVIDANNDQQVSKDEMRKYVEERIRDQQHREFQDLASTLDPNNEGKVTFSAFIRDNYGDEDMSQFEKMENTDLRSRETRRTYMADKDKWQFLDKDGDQSLTYDEYFKFTRPEDNEDLRRMEINSMIKEYDTDNDGRVSNEEYGKMTEAESGQAESLSDELDANHDGFADYEEFARYYLPTSSITMDEETDHLMKECDTDKNGYCSADEIVNAYTSFAGSQVTDFGADLEDGHTEL